MTHTTDLQKLLAGERQTMVYPERLQEIKRRTGSSATESYQLADEALTLLSERDTLAARVIELEAENKRLRAWIENLANNPHKPATWMQTREAAADFLETLNKDTTNDQ